MPDAVPDVPQPTNLQRWLLLTSINILRRFRNRTGSVLMLTSDLCVKYGSRLDIVEAQTMLFIAKHTGIPVPKIYFAFTHEGCTYILMERFNGQSASKGWVHRSDASKQKILESLKKMVLDMRSLTPQSSAICSVSGGSLYDLRIPSMDLRFGPFKNVQEFHDHLRNDTQARSNACDELVILAVSIFSYVVTASLV